MQQKDSQKQSKLLHHWESGKCQSNALTIDGNTALTETTQATYIIKVHKLSRRKYPAGMQVLLMWGWGMVQQQHFGKEAKVFKETVLL